MGGGLICILHRSLSVYQYHSCAVWIYHYYAFEAGEQNGMKKMYETSKQFFLKKTQKIWDILDTNMAKYDQLIKRKLFAG